jgi:hypothetical protein
MTSEVIFFYLVIPLGLVAYLSTSIIVIVVCASARVKLHKSITTQLCANTARYQNCLPDRVSDC